jgi:predicted amidophosphoribosyltransferase
MWRRLERPVERIVPVFAHTSTALLHRDFKNVEAIGIPDSLTLGVSFFRI